MPEPVTIVGAITCWSVGSMLQAVIPNWVAGATQRQVESAPGRLWDALRARTGSLPRNHDLLRAARQALASSVLVLLQSLERQREALSLEERHGLDVLKMLADPLAKDADKAELPAATAAWFERFDALLAADPEVFLQLTAAGSDAGGTVPAAASEALGNFRARFHEAVGKWLREIIAQTGSREHSAIPACLDDWLRDGFDYHAPEGASWRKLFTKATPAAPLRVTLFEVWSQCFFERLKGGQRAFRACLLGYVQDLAGQFAEMKALLTEDLARFRDDTEQQLAACLDSFCALDQRLADLTGLTTTGFAEMRTRLDAHGQCFGILSALAEQSDEQLAQLGSEFENFRTRLETIARGLNEAHQLPFREGPIVPQATSVGTDVTIRDLYYERRWLPQLLARDAESAALRDFLDRPEPFLWWGVVGEAGVGKSRLALELVLEARARGWRAGFLEPRAADPLRLSAANRFDLWQPGYPTLIVIDYASQYGTDIPSALAKLRSVAHGYTHPLRILLLDRPGAVKPLFSELGQREEGRQAADCDHARLCCHRQSAPTFGEKEDLLSLETVPAELWIPFLREVVRRTGITDAAFDAELQRLGKEGLKHFSTALIRATGEGRPLHLQLFGLALARQLAAGATQVDYQTPLALLDEMLEIEVHDRWRLRLPEGEKGNALLPHLQRSVAFVTLCRGLDLTTRANDLRKAVGLGDERDRALIVALSEILGEEHSRAEDGKLHEKLRPLEPDLLAERFVLLGGVLPERPIPGLDEHPFSATALVASGMSFAPGEVAQFLALASRDYPIDAAPLLAAAIPHVPAPALDLAALPVEDHAFVTAIMGTSPIVSLWAAALALIRAGKGLETAAISAAFLEWAQRSDAHALAGLAGALVLRSVLSTERVEDEDLLWADSDAFIRALAPYPADYPPIFARLFAIGESDALVTCAERGRWEDFAVRGETLRVVAKVHPQCGQIQTVLAQGAVNALSLCSKHERWDDLAAWGETLRGVAEAHPQSAEIQTELAKGAFNALHACGKHGRWEDFAAWSETLRAVATAHPQNAEIQIVLTQGAVNALNYCGEHGRWEDFAAWGETLQTVAAAHPENAEIQLQLAQGAVNALNDCGKHEHWDEFAAWREILQKVAVAHPQSAEIQLQLAQGAVNALSACGQYGRWGDFAAWGETLRTAAEAHPQSAEIQTELAKGAFNALNHCGKHGRWDDFAAWGKTLRDVATAHPQSAEIQTELAKGAVNAFSHCGEYKRWEDFATWGKTLRTVAATHPQSLEIQTILVQGTVNALSYCGKHGHWEDFATWGETLQTVAEAHPQSAEIQTELAKGAFNALNVCGAQEHWDDFAAWTKTLQDVATAHPQNTKIQIELVKGAINALSYCGQHERWNEFAAWGKTLRDVATAHPQNTEIQIALTRGAVNALNHCGKQERWEDFAIWGGILHAVAVANPQNAEIQTELAKGATNAISRTVVAGREEDAARWVAILREALPERLTSTKQAEAMQQIFNTLSALQVKHPRPAVAEVIALMEARFVRPGKEETGDGEQEFDPVTALQYLAANLPESQPVLAQVLTQIAVARPEVRTALAAACAAAGLDLADLRAKAGLPPEAPG